MLSRVADSVYWLNRYIERAENVARFVDVNLQLALDLPSGLPQQWQPLVMTTGDNQYFYDKYNQATTENVIFFLCFDKEYPNSIRSCVRSARENARSIREIISSELWEQVNDFYLWMESIAPQDQSQTIDDLHGFLSKVKLTSHLFAGVMDATMSHNEAWHFGLVGRFLERAEKISRILDVKYFILLPTISHVGSALDELEWIALLKSASAYEMYRKYGQQRITPPGVVNFMLLNREFPRSALSCILSAERSIYQISGTALGTWQNKVERSISQLRCDLDFVTVDEIIQSGLHEFLDGLQTKINNVGAEIFDTFFALKSVA
ncbi:MAG: alpha-E domain-containing protein [Pseudanabaenaceae cyanobacterium]